MGIRDVLKSYFVTGAEPTQEQFGELIDSMATVEEVQAIDFDAKFALLSPPVAQQPVGGLIASGNSFTLTVVPGPQVGKSPTQLQWQQQSGSNWLNVSGATSATYTTPTLTTTRTLRVELKNDFGTSYSDIVTVSVLGFSTQPQSGDYYVGNNVTLTAAANLSGVSYQWQEYDGSAWQNVAGATAETLTISNLQLGDDGREFRCVASISGVQSISNVAELTVFGISTQPTEEVTLEGVADTYTIATNQTSATYQWQRSTDGGTTWSDLAAETDSSLAVSGTQANNGRKYRCVVSFRGLTLTSNVVTRHVLFIVTQPTNVSIFEGQTATFTVASSVSGSTFQWHNFSSSWQAISGATSSSYSITNAQRATSNNVQHRCVISAGGVSITSSSATPDIYTPEAITGIQAHYEPRTNRLFQDRSATPSVPVASSGDPVGAWVSSVGSSYANAYSDTRRLIYRPTLFNGNAALESDQVDDAFQFTGLDSCVQNANFLYFFGAVSVTQSNQEFFYASGGAGTVRFRVRRAGTTAIGAYIKVLDTDAGEELQWASQLSNNEVAAIVIEVAASTGKARAWKNGTALAELSFSAASNTFGKVANTASTLVRTGSVAANHGQLGIIKTDTQLSSAQITQLNNYLKYKTGIA